MCNGHGACVGGTHCMCDPSYSGPDCSVPDTPNPDFLKEDFEGKPTSYQKLTGSVLLIYMWMKDSTVDGLCICIVVFDQSEKSNYDFLLKLILWSLHCYSSLK